MSDITFSSKNSLSLSSYDIIMLFGLRVVAEWIKGRKDEQCRKLTNINNIEIGEHCLERVINIMWMCFSDIASRTKHVRNSRAQKKF